MSLRSVSRTITAASLAFAMFSASQSKAQGPVSLNSAIYVERIEAGNIRSLEPAQNLSRGDRVVTVLSWRRLAGNGGFVVTNPLPHTITYQSTSNDGAEVSVDGGRSWGHLGEMRYGTRLATPEDVTHIRWRVAAGTAGRIAYSGIVR